MGNIIRKFNNNQDICKGLEDTCPICLINYQEKNIIILECGHKFHASCIFQTLAVNHNKCPLCRKRMRYIYPNKYNVNRLFKERKILNDKLLELEIKNIKDEEESEEDIYDSDIF